MSVGETSLIKGYGEKNRAELTHIRAVGSVVHLAQIALVSLLERRHDIGEDRAQRLVRPQISVWVVSRSSWSVVASFHILEGAAN